MRELRALQKDESFAPPAAEPPAPDAAPERAPASGEVRRRRALGRRIGRWWFRCRRRERLVLLERPQLAHRRPQAAFQLPLLGRDPDPRPVARGCAAGPEFP